MTTATTSGGVTVDVQDLTQRVHDMYTDVALRPAAGYHFELGRDLAGRLGYRPDLLDRVPAPAVDSFAGVGCPFQLADLQPGERVLDLGSGSGMDIFVAAALVGPHGRVVGRDFTDAQLHSADQLRDEGGFDNVSLSKGPIESLPLDDASFDVVISNGVVNLSARSSRSSPKPPGWCALVVA